MEQNMEKVEEKTNGTTLTVENETTVRNCTLCGCSTPAVRCDRCSCQTFCLSCDDMYHRHPKRRFHLRKAVDSIWNSQKSPRLRRRTELPGDPSKIPIPPPRTKKRPIASSIFSPNFELQGFGYKNLLSKKAAFGAQNGRQDIRSPSPQEANYQNASKGQETVLDNVGRNTLDSPSRIISEAGIQRRNSADNPHSVHNAPQDNITTAASRIIPDQNLLGYQQPVQGQQSMHHSVSATDLTAGHPMPQMCQFPHQLHTFMHPQMNPYGVPLANFSCPQCSSALWSNMMNPNVGHFHPPQWNTAPGLSGSQGHLSPLGGEAMTHISGSPVFHLPAEGTPVSYQSQNGASSPMNVATSLNQAIQQRQIAQSPAQMTENPTEEQIAKRQLEQLLGSEAEESGEEEIVHNTVDLDAPPVVPEKPVEPWTCIHCTYINPPGSHICEVCCKTSYNIDNESPTAKTETRSKTRTKSKSKDRAMEIDDTKGSVSLAKPGSEQEEEVSKSPCAEKDKEKEESGGLEEAECSSESVVKDELSQLFTTETQTVVLTTTTDCQTQKVDLTSTASSTNGFSALAKREMSIQTELELSAHQRSIATDPMISSQSMESLLSGISAPPYHNRRAGMTIGNSFSTQSLSAFDRGRSRSPIPRSASMLGEMQSAGRGLNVLAQEQLVSSWGHPWLASDPMYYKPQGHHTLGSSKDEYFEGNWGSMDRLNKHPKNIDRMPSKPRYHRSLENLKTEQISETPSILHCLQTVKDAERCGYSIEDLKVAYSACGPEDPLYWLQENWEALVKSVISLAAKCAEDNEEHDVGAITAAEAKHALHNHQGKIWEAVNECIELRQRKILELTVRGNFTQKQIVEALRNNDGNVELAYADLIRVSRKILRHILSPGLSEESEDANITPLGSGIGISDATKSSNTKVETPKLEDGIDEDDVDKKKSDFLTKLTAIREAQSERRKAREEKELSRDIDKAPDESFVEVKKEIELSPPDEVISLEISELGTSNVLEAGLSETMMYKIETRKSSSLERSEFQIIPQDLEQSPEKDKSLKEIDGKKGELPEDYEGHWVESQGEWIEEYSDEPWDEDAEEDWVNVRKKYKKLEEEMNAEALEVAAMWDKDEELADDVFEEDEPKEDYLHSPVEVSLQLPFEDKSESSFSEMKYLEELPIPDVSAGLLMLSKQDTLTSEENYDMDANDNWIVQDAEKLLLSPGNEICLSGEEFDEDMPKYEENANLGTLEKSEILTKLSQVSSGDVKFVQDEDENEKVSIELKHSDVVKESNNEDWEKIEKPEPYEMVTTDECVKVEGFEELHVPVADDELATESDVRAHVKEPAFEKLDVYTDTATDLGTIARDMVISEEQYTLPPIPLPPKMLKLKSITTDVAGNDILSVGVDKPSLTPKAPEEESIPRILDEVQPKIPLRRKSKLSESEIKPTITGEYAREETIPHVEPSELAEKPLTCIKQNVIIQDLTTAPSKATHEELNMKDDEVLTVDEDPVQNLESHQATELVPKDNSPVPSCESDSNFFADSESEFEANPEKPKRLYHRTNVDKKGEMLDDEEDEEEMVMKEQAPQLQTEYTKSRVFYECDDEEMPMYRPFGEFEPIAHSKQDQFIDDGLNPKAYRESVGRPLQLFRTTDAPPENSLPLTSLVENANITEVKPYSNVEVVQESCQLTSESPFEYPSPVELLLQKHIDTAERVERSTQDQKDIALHMMETQPVTISGTLIEEPVKKIELEPTTTIVPHEIESQIEQIPSVPRYDAELVFEPYVQQGSSELIPEPLRDANNEMPVLSEMEATSSVADYFFGRYNEITIVKKPKKLSTVRAPPGSKMMSASTVVTKKEISDTVKIQPKVDNVPESKMSQETSSTKLLSKSCVSAKTTEPEELPKPKPKLNVPPPKPEPPKPVESECLSFAEDYFFGSYNEVVPKKEKKKPPTPFQKITGLFGKSQSTEVGPTQPLSKDQIEIPSEVNKMLHQYSSEDAANPPFKIISVVSNDVINQNTIPTTTDMICTKEYVVGDERVPEKSIASELNLVSQGGSKDIPLLEAVTETVSQLEVIESRVPLTSHESDTPSKSNQAIQFDDTIIPLTEPVTATVSHIENMEPKGPITKQSGMHSKTVRFEDTGDVVPPPRAKKMKRDESRPENIPAFEESSMFAADEYLFGRYNEQIPKTKKLNSQAKKKLQPGIKDLEKNPVCVPFYNLPTSCVNDSTETKAQSLLFSQSEEMQHSGSESEEFMACDEYIDNQAQDLTDSMDDNSETLAPNQWQPFELKKDITDFSLVHESNEGQLLISDMMETTARLPSDTEIYISKCNTFNDSIVPEIYSNCLGDFTEDQTTDTRLSFETESEISIATQIMDPTYMVELTSQIPTSVFDAEYLQDESNIGDTPTEDLKSGSDENSAYGYVAAYVQHILSLAKDKLFSTAESEEAYSSGEYEMYAQAAYSTVSDEMNACFDDESPDSFSKQEYEDILENTDTFNISEFTNKVNETGYFPTESDSESSPAFSGSQIWYQEPYTLDTTETRFEEEHPELIEYTSTIPDSEYTSIKDNTAIELQFYDNVKQEVIPEKQETVKTYNVYQKSDIEMAVSDENSAYDELYQTSISRFYEEWIEQAQSLRMTTLMENIVPESISIKHSDVLSPQDNICKYAGGSLPSSECSSSDSFESLEEGESNLSMLSCSSKSSQDFQILNNLEKVQMKTTKRTTLSNTDRITNDVPSLENKPFQALSDDLVPLSSVQQKDLDSKDIRKIEKDDHLQESLSDEKHATEIRNQNVKHTQVIKMTVNQACQTDECLFEEEQFFDSLDNGIIKEVENHVAELNSLKTDAGIQCQLISALQETQLQSTNNLLNEINILQSTVIFSTVPSVKKVTIRDTKENNTVLITESLSVSEEPSFFDDESESDDTSSRDVFADSEFIGSESKQTVNTLIAAMEPGLTESDSGNGSFHESDSEENYLDTNSDLKHSESQVISTRLAEQETQQTTVDMTTKKASLDISSIESEITDQLTHLEKMDKKIISKGEQTKGGSLEDKVSLQLQTKTDFIPEKVPDAGEIQHIVSKEENLQLKSEIAGQHTVEQAEDDVDTTVKMSLKSQTDMKERHSTVLKENESIPESLRETDSTYTNQKPASIMEIFANEISQVDLLEKKDSLQETNSAPTISSLDASEHVISKDVKPSQGTKEIAIEHTAFEQKLASEAASETGSIDIACSSPENQTTMEERQPTVVKQIVLISESSEQQDFPSDDKNHSQPNTEVYSYETQIPGSQVGESLFEPEENQGKDILLSSTDNLIGLDVPKSHIDKSHSEVELGEAFHITYFPSVSPKFAFQIPTVSDLKFIEVHELSSEDASIFQESEEKHKPTVEYFYGKLPPSVSKTIKMKGINLETSGGKEHSLLARSGSLSSTEGTVYSSADGRGSISEEVWEDARSYRELSSSCSIERYADAESPVGNQESTEYFIDANTSQSDFTMCTDDGLASLASDSELCSSSSSVVDFELQENSEADDVQVFECLDRSLTDSRNVENDSLCVFEKQDDQEYNITSDVDLDEAEPLVSLPGYSSFTKNVGSTSDESTEDKNKLNQTSTESMHTQQILHIEKVAYNQHLGVHHLQISEDFIKQSTANEANLSDSEFSSPDMNTTEDDSSTMLRTSDEIKIIEKEISHTGDCKEQSSFHKESSIVDFVHSRSTHPEKCPPSAECYEEAILEYTKSDEPSDIVKYLFYKDDSNFYEKIATFSEVPKSSDEQSLAYKVQDEIKAAIIPEVGDDEPTTSEIHTVSITENEEFAEALSHDATIDDSDEWKDVKSDDLLEITDEFPLDTLKEQSNLTSTLESLKNEDHSKEADNIPDVVILQSEENDALSFKTMSYDKVFDEVTINESATSKSSSRKNIEDDHTEYYDEPSTSEIHRPVSITKTESFVEAAAQRTQDATIDDTDDWKDAKSGDLLEASEDFPIDVAVKDQSDIKPDTADIQKVEENCVFSFKTVSYEKISNEGTISETTNLETASNKDAVKNVSDQSAISSLDSKCIETPEFYEGSSALSELVSASNLPEGAVFSFRTASYEMIPGKDAITNETPALREKISTMDRENETYLRGDVDAASTLEHVDVHEHHEGRDVASQISPETSIFSFRTMCYENADESKKEIDENAVLRVTPIKETSDINTPESQSHETTDSRCIGTTKQKDKVAEFSENVDTSLQTQEMSAFSFRTMCYESISGIEEKIDVSTISLDNSLENMATLGQSNTTSDSRYVKILKANEDAAKIPQTDTFKSQEIAFSFRTMCYETIPDKEKTSGESSILNENTSEKMGLLHQAPVNSNSSSSKSCEDVGSVESLETAVFSFRTMSYEIASDQEKIAEKKQILKGSPQENDNELVDFKTSSYSEKTIKYPNEFNIEESEIISKPSTTVQGIANYSFQSCIYTDQLIQTPKLHESTELEANFESHVTRDEDISATSFHSVTPESDEVFHLDTHSTYTDIEEDISFTDDKICSDVVDFGAKLTRIPENQEIVEQQISIINQNDLNIKSSKGSEIGQIMYPIPSDKLETVTLIEGKHTVLDDGEKMECPLIVDSNIQEEISSSSFHSLDTIVPFSTVTSASESLQLVEHAFDVNVAQSKPSELAQLETLSIAKAYFAEECELPIVREEVGIFHAKLPSESFHASATDLSGAQDTSGAYLSTSNKLSDAIKTSADKEDTIDDFSEFSEISDFPTDSNEMGLMYASAQSYSKKLTDLKSSSSTSHEYFHPVNRIPSGSIPGESMEIKNTSSKEDICRADTVEDISEISEISDLIIDTSQIDDIITVSGPSISKFSITATSSIEEFMNVESAHPTSEFDDEWTDVETDNLAEDVIEDIKIVQDSAVIEDTNATVILSHQIEQKQEIPSKLSTNETDRLTIVPDNTVKIIPDQAVTVDDVKTCEKCNESSFFVKIQTSDLPLCEVEENIVPKTDNLACNIPNLGDIVIPTNEDFAQKKDVKLQQLSTIPTSKAQDLELASKNLIEIEYDEESLSLTQTENYTDVPSFVSDTQESERWSDAENISLLDDNVKISSEVRAPLTGKESKVEAIGNMEMTSSVKSNELFEKVSANLDKASSIVDDTSELEQSSTITGTASKLRDVTDETTASELLRYGTAASEKSSEDEQVILNKDIEINLKRQRSIASKEEFNLTHMPDISHKNKDEESTAIVTVLCDDSNDEVKLEKKCVFSLQQIDQNENEITSQKTIELVSSSGTIESATVIQVTDDRLLANKNDSLPLGENAHFGTQVECGENEISAASITQSEQQSIVEHSMFLPSVPVMAKGLRDPIPTEDSEISDLIATSMQVTEQDTKQDDSCEITYEDANENEVETTSQYESWSDRSFELDRHVLEYEQSEDEDFTREHLVFDDDFVQDEDEEAILRAVDRNLQNFDANRFGEIDHYIDEQYNPRLDYDHDNELDLNELDEEDFLDEVYESYSDLNTVDLNLNYLAPVFEENESSTYESFVSSTSDHTDNILLPPYEMQLSENIPEQTENVPHEQNIVLDQENICEQVVIDHKVVKQESDTMEKSVEIDSSDKINNKTQVDAKQIDAFDSEEVEKQKAKTKICSDETELPIKIPQKLTVDSHVEEIKLEKSIQTYQKPTDHDSSKKDKADSNNTDTKDSQLENKPELLNEKVSLTPCKDDSLMIKSGDKTKTIDTDSESFKMEEHQLVASQKLDEKLAGLKDTTETITKDTESIKVHMTDTTDTILLTTKYSKELENQFSNETDVSPTPTVSQNLSKRKSTYEFKTAITDFESVKDKSSTPQKSEENLVKVDVKPASKDSEPTKKHKSPSHSSVEVEVLHKTNNGVSQMQTIVHDSSKPDSKDIKLKTTKDSMVMSKTHESEISKTSERTEIPTSSTIIAQKTITEQCLLESNSKITPKESIKDSEILKKEESQSGSRTTEVCDKKSSQKPTTADNLLKQDIKNTAKIPDEEDNAPIIPPKKPNVVRQRLQGKSFESDDQSQITQSQPLSFPPAQEDLRSDIIIPKSPFETKSKETVDIFPPQLRQGTSLKEDEQPLAPRRRRSSSTKYVSSDSIEDCNVQEHISDKELQQRRRSSCRIQPVEDMTTELQKTKGLDMTETNTVKRVRRRGSSGVSTSDMPQPSHDKSKIVSEKVSSRQEDSCSKTNKDINDQRHSNLSSELELDSRKDTWLTESKVSECKDLTKDLKTGMDSSGESDGASGDRRISRAEELNKLDRAGEPDPETQIVRRVSYGKRHSIASEETGSRKKRLSVEERMLKLQTEGKCDTSDKAFIAAKLIEMQFEEEDALLASKQCSSVYHAIKFLTQLCVMCNCRYPINQMPSMVYCPHKACKECLKAHFTTLIYDRSIFSLLCPICYKPDITDQNIQDYFNHLDMMLRKILKPDVYDLFQKKLRDEVLTKDPNFHWCSQCSSGFIASPRLKKLYCPDCSAITCASCHQTWELEHEGVHCERFQQWKDMHTPEPPPAGLVKKLTDRGVTCPSCGIEYPHACGGCMLYKCASCNFEFCGFCYNPYKKGKECKVTTNCENLSLHCHHPHNCLFFIRDKHLSDLQDLLKKEKITYLTIPPPDQIVKSRCQVREEKHVHGAITEDRCGRDIEPYFAGLCRVHYMEYIAELLREKKLDITPIMTTMELQFMLRKARIFIPEKMKSESIDDYRAQLLKTVKEESTL